MAGGGARILVVTAVEAEREAVLRGCGTGTVDVLAAGVGPAAAAAGTATALATAGEPYALVVSAGIGGGFAPAVPVGGTVVASRIVAADLGAELPPAASAPGGPAGFADVAELGFGTAVHLPPAAQACRAAAAAGAVLGPVLTVSTVTGTAGRAALLAARHPGAAAEAMEGFGVAEAASRHGTGVLEVRAVSNTVGPRERAAWRVPGALAALSEAFSRIVPVLQDRRDHD